MAYKQFVSRTMLLAVLQCCSQLRDESQITRLAGILHRCA